MERMDIAAEVCERGTRRHTNALLSLGKWGLFAVLVGLSEGPMKVSQMTQRVGTCLPDRQRRDRVPCMGSIGYQLVQTCAAIREPGAFSVSSELLVLGFGSCSTPSLTFNQYGGREEQRKYFRKTEARDQASDVGLGGMLRNDVGDWTQNLPGLLGGLCPQQIQEHFQCQVPLI